MIATLSDRAACQSEILRGLIGASDKLIGSPLSSLIERPSKDLLTTYIASTAHIIRASVDLMVCARESIKDNLSGRLGLLNDYLQEHIEEESGHYEWIVEDLKSLNPDYMRFLDETMVPSVVAIPGSSYYLIRNISPWSVLGYIAALESTPPTNSVIAAIQNGTGAPASAFRTLLLHGELDHGHADELYAFIDNASLSESEFSAVRQSCYFAIVSYANAMSEILPRHGIK